MKIDSWFEKSARKKVENAFVIAVWRVLTFKHKPEQWRKFQL